MTDVTLLHGDCLALLPTLPAGSVDLILADLPYGTTVCAWDSVIPLNKLWSEYKRVLNPRGAVVLTASQPFTSALILSNPEWFKYTWVWEKSIATNFLNSPNRPLMAHEDVCVFSPGTIANGSPHRMIYNPQLNMAVPAWRKVVGAWESEPHNGSVFGRGNRRSHMQGEIRERDGRMPRSVLRIPNGNYQAVHPTQKPVALMAYLIRTYSNPGDTILDNCMGSGTTGVAAVNEGRRFIGMEQDAAYFALAQRRIMNAQPPLFVEVGA